MATASRTPKRLEVPNEEWMRVLFEAIDDAVFVHDQHGNILEVNPAACRRLGYTRDELLQMHTREIDDPEFAAGFEERLRVQIQSCGYRCEGRHRAKDGRLIPVDINTSAVEVRGQPAILAVMRDITQRQQAEEALRKQGRLLQSILDNMGDAVLVADANLRLMVFNPAAQRMFGLETEASVLPSGLARFELFLPDKVTPFPLDQLPLVRSIRGEEVDEVEMFIRHPQTPAGLWISITGRPLRDEQGVVRGGVIVCRDITERKRTESRLTLQYAVTQALGEGTSLEESARQILQIIGAALGFDLGVLWVVNKQAFRLECLGVWKQTDLQATELETWSRFLPLASGVGLPGQVWEQGKPIWMDSRAAGEHFPRTPVAVKEGLLGCCAFPVQKGDQTIGVLEFFTRAPQQPDQGLFNLMMALGNQIGQVLERQRVEKALRDSEALYHSLVECLPQNIIRKDRLGRVTFANQRYCLHMNTSLAEVLGQTDFDLFPPALAQKYVTDDKMVMDTGAILETVEGHLKPDGSKLYVEVVKTPIRDAQGNIIGTQCLFWDVTARKQAEDSLSESERRYRQLTEATQDGIIVADQEGRVTLFNPAAERLFGCSAADIMGQPVTLLMPEKWRQVSGPAFVRFLLSQGQRYVGRVLELSGCRQDGNEFPVELVFSVINLGASESNGRESVQILAAIRDVTERNRIRSVLMQNEKLASIGLLSAGVAHEINNPLAFVGNNLVVLERDAQGLLTLMEAYEQVMPTLAAADPAAAQRVQEIMEEIDLPYLRDNWLRLLKRTREGVDRVSRIVHSLRGLARTDTPRCQETFLPDLVDNSVEILRNQIKRACIEVVQEHDPNPKVPCLPTQMNQVFLNLLVNAVHAIQKVLPHGGGRILVRTQRLAKEMLIEVSDNGCGIDAAHLPRIFDPFFTTKEVGEGTGLGLAISHNIVTGHGGNMEVQSQPGQGSCFRITLPLTTA